MATTSMNQIIHAADRRDVARTEQALRTLPEGDRSRARQLQAAWQNLVWELTHHRETEDELVWPFLRSRGFDADADADADGVGERELTALRETIPSPVLEGRLDRLRAPLSARRRADLAGLSGRTCAVRGG